MYLPSSLLSLPVSLTFLIDVLLLQVIVWHATEAAERKQERERQRNWERERELLHLTNMIFTSFPPILPPLFLFLFHLHLHFLLLFFPSVLLRRIDVDCLNSSNAMTACHSSNKTEISDHWLSMLCELPILSAQSKQWLASFCLFLCMCVCISACLSFSLAFTVCLSVSLCVTLSWSINKNIPTHAYVYNVCGN